MGETRHLHQHVRAGLLYRLYATRGGCGFLQHGGDFVQDAAIIHMAVRCGYRAIIDNDVYIGRYIGGIASPEGCYCRYTVREYK